MEKREETEKRLPDIHLLTVQLCGCNFPSFTVTLTQAARMKTLYLWARNALWRQKSFPMRPRGPFSTAPAHVNRGTSARSLQSNCQITLMLRVCCAPLGWGFLCRGTSSLMCLRVVVTSKSNIDLVVALISCRFCVLLCEGGKRSEMLLLQLWLNTETDLSLFFFVFIRW